MKIGPYEIGTIDARVLCSEKIGGEVSMENEPKPCKCGKLPSVFKIFGEWEVSCEDECAEIRATTKAHAIEIWNERHAALPPPTDTKPKADEGKSNE